MLNLLVLRCKEIVNTKDFYEKLGLTFVEEQHDNSPIHYSCSLNELVLELYPATKNFPVDSCRLGFSVANFNALSKSIDTSIQHRKGVEFFVVTDPDGRKVDITR